MMKFNKKLIGLVLALAMLLSLFAVNIAADGSTTDTVEYTVVVYLEKEDIYGAEGTFRIEYDSNVESATILAIENYGSFGFQQANLDTMKFLTANVDKTKGDMKVAVALSIVGKVGGKVTLHADDFGYVATEDDIVNDVLTGENWSKTIDVVDYSALRAQVERKNALNADKLSYKDDAWAAVEAAYEVASSLLRVERPTVIDAPNYAPLSDITSATNDLKDVLDALADNLLVLDFGELNTQIQAAEAKLPDADKYYVTSWLNFLQALDYARVALSFRVQEEITAAAEELEQAIEALKPINDRYNEGLEEGREQGKADKEEAVSEAESKAYANGFAEGNADKEEAVSEAESEAYAEGYAAGYEAGEDAGYEKGYAAGLAAAGNQGSETPDDNPENPDTPADRYQEGYEAGYKKGYDDGYKQGLIDGAPETDAIEETEPVDTQAPDETETAVPDVDEKSSTLWIVLFIVFLTTTLGLAAYIVVTMVLKKKKETDDTPVVDYNIEDDIDTDAAGDATADANSDAETDTDAE